MSSFLLNITRSFSLLCLLLRFEASPISAAEEPGTPASKPKTVRLLTVGNSFSQNATRFLGELAKADGNVLVFHGAVIGGGTLAQHWEKAQQHEKDPQDVRGFYSSKRSLQEELVAEPWDFITIQQASIKSHDASTYRPFAGDLSAYIRKLAPRAELIMHQTWAYRSDDSRFALKSPKPGEPATQEAMYQALTQAYQSVATELGIRTIPVGDAFHLADTDPVWGYQADKRFDSKSAQQPALPDQTHSLHIGWQWKKPVGGTTIKLGMDGHHANASGEYLGGCVFYEVLFGRTVVGNTFIPKLLDPAYARYLQETAHRAVGKMK